MGELSKIRDAVINALNQSDVTALPAFPVQRARRYQGAVAAVSVDTAQGKAVGFCNYLGEWYDSAAKTVRELYGKQLEGTIAIDVRAERASCCEEGCEAVSSVLLGGLPEGIRPGELRWEGLHWEKETGMFLRRGFLSCRALFVAESGGDDEPFLDFILKGVCKSE